MTMYVGDSLSAVVRTLSRAWSVRGLEFLVSVVILRVNTGKDTIRD